MHFRKITTILLASLTLFAFTGFERAYAQNQGEFREGPKPIPGPKDDGAPMPELDKQPVQGGFEIKDESSTDDDVIETDAVGDIKPIEDDYIKTTYDNLAKLYWALGMYKPDDTKAVDNFLLINECDLYQRYYNNDFEWLKIREATHEQIKKDIFKYPTKFEILIPIELGRYDVDKQEFDITQGTKIVDMRKLDFSNNSIYKPTCSIPGEIKGYPHNIIVTLNRAFSIERVPVDPEIAEMYLDETRDKNSLLPGNIQLAAYHREAFLRLKVHITKYKETVYSSSGDLRAVVFATVDGIEVYADSHKMKPMFMTGTDSKRGVKFRRGGAMLTTGITGLNNPPKMPRAGSNAIVSFGDEDKATNTPPTLKGAVEPDTSMGSSDYDTNYDHAPNEKKPPKKTDPAPAPAPTPAPDATAPALPTDPQPAY